MKKNLSIIILLKWQLLEPKKFIVQCAIWHEYHFLNQTVYVYNFEIKKDPPKFESNKTAQCMEITNKESLKFYISLFLTS